MNKAKAARGVFVLVISVIAGAMGWNANREFANLTALHTSGIAASATVTGKHIQRGRHTDYYVNYTFTTSASAFSGSEDVTLTRYNAANMGGSVPITYLPSHPQTNCIGPVTPTRISDARGAWILAYVLLVACGSIFYAVIPYYVK